MTNKKKAIEKFISTAKKNKDVIFYTAKPGCGVYYKSSNELKNLDCLAVAKTKTNDWFTLDLDLNERFFKANQLI